VRAAAVEEEGERLEFLRRVLTVNPLHLDDERTAALLGRLREELTPGGRQAGR
jgi:hypothetical protein